MIADQHAVKQVLINGQSKLTLNLKVDETADLSVSFVGVNTDYAPREDLTWTVKDTKGTIAFNEATGRVTALQPGTATLTAIGSGANGKQVKGTVTVKVTK